MKLLPIGLIVFGIVVIAFPALLAMLIGGLFIFIGLNLLFVLGIIGGGKKPAGEKEDYIKVGKYKIYR
jgi:hypothetical protein